MSEDTRKVTSAKETNNGAIPIGLRLFFLTGVVEEDDGDYDIEAGIFQENIFCRTPENVSETLHQANLNKSIFEKISMAISVPAILTLMDSAASNVDLSGELKIVAFVNGIGFTSTLISMLYKNNKYSSIMGKIGAICSSAGLIGSMGLLLKVYKVIKWTITGILSFIPCIAVSLA